MAKWLRVNSNIDSHPKFVAAGFWGQTVVLALWRLAKEFDRYDGDITQFFNMEYLSTFLRYNDLEHIAEGMDDALTSGLVEKQEGHFFLHDWQTFQREARNYDRVKAWRERQKESVSTVIRNVPDNVTGDNSNRTEQNNTTIACAEKPRPRVPSKKASEATELLRYYHDQMVEKHNIKPVLAFGGKDHAIAKLVVNGRGLDEAKALVDAYLKLDGDIEAEGWPWALMPSRAGKLQKGRKAEARLLTADEQAALDPERAEQLQEFRKRYEGKK